MTEAELFRADELRGANNSDEIQLDLEALDENDDIELTRFRKTVKRCLLLNGILLAVLALGVAFVLAFMIRDYKSADVKQQDQNSAEFALIGLRLAKLEELCG